MVKEPTFQKAVIELNISVMHAEHKKIAEVSTSKLTQFVSNKLEVEDCSA